MVAITKQKSTTTTAQTTRTPRREAKMTKQDGPMGATIMGLDTRRAQSTNVTASPLDRSEHVDTAGLLAHFRSQRPPTQIPPGYRDEWLELVLDEATSAMGVRPCPETQCSDTHEDCDTCHGSLFTRADVLAPSSVANVRNQIEAVLRPLAWLVGAAEVATAKPRSKNEAMIARVRDEVGPFLSKLVARLDDLATQLREAGVSDDTSPRVMLVPGALCAHLERHGTSIEKQRTALTGTVVLGDVEAADRGDVPASVDDLRWILRHVGDEPIEDVLVRIVSDEGRRMWRDWIADRRRVAVEAAADGVVSSDFTSEDDEGGCVVALKPGALAAYLARKGLTFEEAGERIHTDAVRLRGFDMGIVPMPFGLLVLLVKIECGEGPAELWSLASDDGVATAKAWFDAHPRSARFGDDHDGER